MLDSGVSYICSFQDIAASTGNVKTKAIKIMIKQQILAWNDLKLKKILKSVKLYALKIKAC